MGFSFNCPVGTKKESLYLKQGTQIEHWNRICHAALGFLNITVLERGGMGCNVGT